MDSIRVCSKARLGKYGFFLAAGISVLAKGPVSLVFVRVDHLVLSPSKRWDLFWRLAFHPGVILAVTVFLFMVRQVPFGSAEKSSSVLQFIKENFERFFVHGEGGTGHQKPIYYFISIIHVRSTVDAAVAVCSF
jgi:4-amino-4-deoxy-L-arabinose transferase-like glycosyltransferase